MSKLVLLACLLAAALVGATAFSTPSEDYSLRWNYVHHHVIGDLKAETALFNTWKAKMSRTYPTPAEEQFRFAMFQNTLRRVIAKNDKLPKGKSNHGLNKFSDMDPAEWANMYLSKKVHSEAKKKLLHKCQVRKPKATALPTNGIDWQALNGVTYVKDQGQCGSCWAFSVVETVESQWMISKNVTNDLSPQQIVDCDWGDGNQGCNGGDPAVAYAYVMKVGLMTDSDYPYFSGDTGDNGTCEYVASKVAARISGFSYAAPPCSNGTCNTFTDYTLAQNIASHGPAGIIVDASNWQDYTWGSFSDCSNGAADMDHGVQVTGYQRSSSTAAHLVDIWMVRNSWGEDWGNMGYIDLVGSTYQNNTCGITNEAIYADL